MEISLKILGSYKRLTESNVGNALTKQKLGLLQFGTASTSGGVNVKELEHEIMDPFDVSFTRNFAEMGATKEDEEKLMVMKSFIKGASRGGAVR